MRWKKPWLHAFIVCSMAESYFRRIIRIKKKHFLFNTKPSVYLTA